MSKEVKKWITVNGNHIPIYDGQSKDEAVKNFMNKQENKKSVTVKDKKVKVHKKTTYDRDSFDDEAKKQGLDITSDDIEEYVESSYGGVQLGDKVSEFIDNCPDEMKVGDDVIYRGLYFNDKNEFDDFIKKHTEGQVLESRRDGLSWSKSKEVADVFSKEAGDYYVTLVNEDDAKNAISIKDIADTMVSSEEVLYSSSTDFEVTDVELEGNHATIYVTEAVVSKKKYK